MESLYAQFREQPASVDSSWQSVFRFIDDLIQTDDPAAVGTAQGGAAAALRATLLRRYGHLLADLNPLADGDPPPVDVLEAFFAGQWGLETDPDTLRRQYTGTLAVETAHMTRLDRVQWVDERLSQPWAACSDDVLIDAWRSVVAASEFERFLMTRFPGKKKFGLEGAEILSVVLDQILTQAARMGVEEVVLGSMHRGRLNLMANVLGKPLVDLLAEFMGLHPFPEAPDIPADIPYHLGYEGTVTKGGRSVRVRLLPNPSHLEAVDPVALGVTRARQAGRPDGQSGNVLGVILHTDAAVIGQGIVSECLQLGAVAGFSTAGTIHVVVNNQLGFTTEPDEGRSSYHCTDSWKAVDGLILHVNGECPESAIRAAGLAVEYRQAQACDAVIDLVVYRRHGHNEFDEPRFTQPVLYQAIDQREPLGNQLEKRLLASGALDPQAARDFAKQHWKQLDLAFEAAGQRKQRAVDQAGEPGLAAAIEPVPSPQTGVPQERLLGLLEALAHVPDGLTLGDRLAKQIRARSHTEQGVAWAVAEALAFASLLAEGLNVRLSGQDVARGAFSHRHFVLTDVHDNRRYCSLNHLGAGQGAFEVINSPLSEYAVLGFEYGHSLAAKNTLTLWEAQFGDFANGAQIMIDQFITSGACKWRQSSGLVVLLPHGLEGQGPEHSSARIERYLQLCAHGNLWLINPTTPANYFHALRQHVLDGQERPLIVVAPKTLLRLPAAVSPLAAFCPGTRFSALHVSPASSPARRLLVCSGKIAYELEDHRQAHHHPDVTIVRLEQLYPLPTDELRALLQNHPSADLVWVQEEPENMGAWPYYDRRLEDLARLAGCAHPRFRFCGRPESASPAGSFHSSHAQDQAVIIERAFA